MGYYNPPASGSGAVNNVTNSDGSLTINPTTGAVIASINEAHANVWTALQTFNAHISLHSQGTISTLVDGVFVMTDNAGTSGVSWNVGLDGSIVFNSRTNSKALALQTTGALVSGAGSALVAGGDTTIPVLIGNAHLGVYAGSGAPTISADQGSLYLRSDGGPYYNTDGSTGWASLAGGGSALVPGTTSVTGGTDGGIFYQHSGLLESAAAIVDTATGDVAFPADLTAAGYIITAPTVAPVSGGDINSGLLGTSTPNFGVYFGSGFPGPALDPVQIGSLYFQIDADYQTQHVTGVWFKSNFSATSNGWDYLAPATNPQFYGTLFIEYVGAITGAGTAITGSAIQFTNTNQDVGIVLDYSVDSVLNLYERSRGVAASFGINDLGLVTTQNGDGLWTFTNAAATAGATWDVTTDGVMTARARDGSSAGSIVSTGTIASAAPAGSSSGSWKLGAVDAGAVTLDATQSLFVDVGGTVLKVLLAA